MDNYQMYVPDMEKTKYETRNVIFLIPDLIKVAYYFSGIYNL